MLICLGGMRRFGGVSLASSQSERHRFNLEYQINNNSFVCIEWLSHCRTLLSITSDISWISSLDQTPRSMTVLIVPASPSAFPTTSIPIIASGQCAQGLTCKFSSAPLLRFDFAICFHRVMVVGRHAMDLVRWELDTVTAISRGLGGGSFEARTLCS